MWEFVTRDTGKCALFAFQKRVNLGKIHELLFVIYGCPYYVGVVERGLPVSRSNCCLTQCLNSYSAWPEIAMFSG